MTLSQSAILLLALLLPACAAAKPWPLLREVRAINADGTLSAPLADKDIAPFLQLLRARIPAGPPKPTAIFALEVDVPQGAGNEGDYLALVYTGAAAELRYFEQSAHRPRADRYYQRPLTAEELAEFNGFLQAHPLAQLRRIPPAPAAAPAPATAPAGEPATAPAPAAAAADESGARGAAAPGPPGAGSAAILFRLTDARLEAARTLVLDSPGPNDHPAVDLLRLLAQFRDAAPYTCTYLQPIPLTAKSLYADPYRKVLWVWANGDDLRIAVSSPLHPLDAPPEGPDEHWLAHRDGRWEACAAPGSEPATEPGTEPATAPAAAPATEPGAPAATAPGPRMALPYPGLLPETERWWTQPNVNATTVFHYVPLSPTHGITHGFVVPAFIFDDDHCAVDAARGMLYLIHEGQLFSLVIPEAARGR